MYTYRPTGGVLGFTRETVIALTTNIESREYVRRTQNTPEHPRASSTDDVECLFSIMRDLAGKHFTLRTWNYNWRKVCLELSKRLDPYLGFTTTQAHMIVSMRVRGHPSTDLGGLRKTHELGEFAGENY